MDTFEWTEETPVTANNMNEMQNIINNNISQSLKWNYLGTTQGNNSITLPNSFNELLCKIKLGGNDSVQFSIVIPYISLSGTTQGFNNGYEQQNVGISAGCRLAITTSSAYLTVAYLNTNNVLSTSSVEYYYR